MKKQQTTLLIRPAARGGKYLGHDAANAQNHSALIALLHPATGEVITHAFAKAPTAQSAGPLQLMGCTKRSDPFAADSGTVHVRLSVEIDEPTVFRVVVYGPLSHPEQARMAQADITVLPGVNVGLSAQYPEGLVVEVPGLCISNVTSNLQGAQITCTARVAMMCGCQIHEGATDPYWPWPDTDFSVQLLTLMRSKAVFYYPLAFDSAPGSVSSFTGQWPSQAAPGDAVEQAWVYASEPKLGNQGEYRISSSQPVPLPLSPELQKLLLAASR